MTPVDSPLRIRMFGPLDVSVEGRPLPRLRSRKGQWLLSLLALRHGSEVDRTWLAGMLWPDVTEARAGACLPFLMSSYACRSRPTATGWAPLPSLSD